MTNEKMVEEIKKGINVNENMLALYQNNLPLIKSFINHYAEYDCQDDLLQEAFLGLWDAVDHFNPAMGFKFMSYAKYRIQNKVALYIEKNSLVVNMSQHMQQKIRNYKKVINQFKTENLIYPTDKEVAEIMNISLKEVFELQVYSQPIVCLDAVCKTNEDDQNTTIGDTIKSDYDMEDSIVNDEFEKYKKTFLWELVKSKVSTREYQILYNYFVKKISFNAMAEQEGISASRINSIKLRAIQKLQSPGVKRNINEKLELIDTNIYKNGYGRFCEDCFTSNVEKIAIKHQALLENEYIKNYRKSLKEMYLYE